MEFGSTNKNWRAVTGSVRGASHERTGAPNQDATGIFPASGDGPPMVLAVSDGHGSAKSFRSNIGSQLAVETALAVLQELIGKDDQSPDPTTVKRAAEERVPQAIERRWKEKVAAHLREQSFSAEELQRLETTEGPQARKKVEDHPTVVYGCTLLAVLIEPGFVVFVQIGDGDMMVVTEEGEVSQPIARDPRHFANETTSLSSEHSWQSVQVGFQLFAGSPPVLILLCTDGYTNAFRSQQDFHNVGREFVEALRTEGVEAVASDLPELLQYASRHGSGDDVTVGNLFRTDGDVAVWPDWRAEQEATEKAALQKAASAEKASEAASQGAANNTDEWIESVAGPSPPGETAGNNASPDLGRGPIEPPPVKPPAAG